jgi:hypothetical protein
MAIFRQIHTAFWQDSRVLEEMTPEDKYFYLYLLTNPNTTQIGIYQITKKQMAFNLGYSTESINSLLERFINTHKVIKYNEFTRELAIIHWGKYNLKKAGKPIIDCITMELKQIKDVSLLTEVANHIPNESIKEMFLRHVHDTYNDTYTSSGQEKEKEEEKEEEEEKEVGETFCRKQVSDESSVYYKLSDYLFQKIKENNPDHKPPNLKQWANDVRLMIDRDKRTVEQITYVIDWCQSNSFWKANILSISKLREKFDRLVAQIKADKSKPNKHTRRQEMIPDWMKDDYVPPNEDSSSDVVKQQELLKRLEEYQKNK